MLMLHLNEYGLGLSQSTRQVLQSTSQFAYAYPVALRKKLRLQLARSFGLETEQVLCSAGATDVLRMALTDLAQQERSQLFCSMPTYAPLGDFANRLGIPFSTVPLAENLRVDLATLRQAVEAYDGYAIVYLCTPDCYTGELLDSEVLRQWILNASENVFFIIDEAYMEFTGPAAQQHSLASLLQTECNHVLVLRTFSKLFALAGLRVGYGLTSMQRASLFQRYGTDSTIGMMAVRAALDAYQDKEWIKHSLALVEVSRTLLLEGLLQMGLPCHTGPVNFVLHALPCDATVFCQNMLLHGIKVACPIEHLPAWCRVAVATVEQQNFYLQTLKLILHSSDAGSRLSD